MNQYSSYKDSGVEWIGEIPSKWESNKIKYLFREKKSTPNPNLNSGSISFGKVVYKDDESIPESTKNSYQEVLEGEFLINPLNLNYDLKSLRIGLSKLNVVVSQGYIVLIINRANGPLPPLAVICPVGNIFIFLFVYKEVNIVCLPLGVS